MQLSKLKDILSADSTITKINKLLEDEAKNSYVSQPSHRPSYLGTPCLRKIYYSYNRVEEDNPTTAQGLRIFGTGGAFEKLVLGWLIKIGEHVPYRNKSNGEIPKHFITGEPDTQFPIHSTRWRIKKGKIDNVAVVKGETWLYEIKSAKANKFSKLTEPLPEHLIQVAIYFQTFNDLYLAGEYDHIPEIKGGGKAKGVKVIYINKDTSELKEFVLTAPILNPIVLQLDKKIMILNNYIDNKMSCPFRGRTFYVCKIIRAPRSVVQIG